MTSSPPNPNNEQAALSDAQLEGMSLEQLRSASAGLEALRRRGLLGSARLFSDTQLDRMTPEQLDAVLAGALDAKRAHDRRQSEAP